MRGIDLNEASCSTGWWVVPSVAAWDGVGKVSGREGGNTSSQPQGGLAWEGAVSRVEAGEEGSQDWALTHQPNALAA